MKKKSDPRYAIGVLDIRKTVFGKTAKIDIPYVKPPLWYYLIIVITGLTFIIGLLAGIFLVRIDGIIIPTPIHHLYDEKLFGEFYRYEE